MKLLAIDASTNILSVAVANGDKIFITEQDSRLRASDIVMGCIDSQMKKAGLEPGDLNGVLCTGGPGSFTGLRTGYSVSKGLALALSIPFVPVPTLDCVYLAANEKINYPCFLFTLIKAGKSSFYYSVFQGTERIIEDCEISNDMLIETVKKYLLRNEKIVIFGNGADVFEDALKDESSIEIINHDKGFAKELIALAGKNDLFEFGNSKYLYMGPEYIKKSDAEMK